MGCVLLIGNGINRCVTDDVSAENLISFLSEEKKCRLADTGKPFSLCFESLLGKSNIKVTELFQKIKDNLQFLNTHKNEVLLDVKKLVPYLDAILTTNYDFAIEYNVFNQDTSKKDFKTKPIGSNNSHKGYKFKNDLKGQPNVYHIHGDLNHINNICLGYLGYQKYLKSCSSNMKQDIASYKNTNFFELLEKGKKEKRNEKNKSILPESYRYLLEDDVYILGLNLSDSELVLWYILTLRSELIRQEIYEKENKHQNKIVYYDAYIGETDEEKKIEKDKLAKANSDYFENLNIEYVAEELKLNKPNKQDKSNEQENSDELNKLYSDFYKRKLDEILLKVKGNKQ